MKNTVTAPADATIQSGLGDLLLDCAARSPDAPHLLRVMADDSVASQTYGETAARARAIAFALLGQGLALDEPVAVLGDSTLPQIEAVFGVWLAGGVLVPLDPQWLPSSA